MIQVSRYTFPRHQHSVAQIWADTMFLSGTPHYYKYSNLDSCLKGDDLHTRAFTRAQGQPLRQRGAFQHRVSGRLTDGKRIPHICLSRGQRGGQDIHAVLRGAFRSRTQSGRLPSRELKGGLIL